MPIDGLNTVGQRIRYARKELRKVTQLQLAIGAGIKQASLSELETGETKEISGPTLISLAKELRVRAEWLMTGELPIEVANRIEQPQAVYNFSSEALEIAQTYDTLPQDCRQHLRNQAALLKRVQTSDGDRERAEQHDGEFRDGMVFPSTDNIAVATKVVPFRFIGTAELEAYVAARHMEAAQGKLIGSATLWMYSNNHYTWAIKGEIRRSPLGARAMLPQLVYHLDEIIRSK